MKTLIEDIIYYAVLVSAFIGSIAGLMTILTRQMVWKDIAFISASCWCVITTIWLLNQVIIGITDERGKDVSR